jgi:hypothetical protein
MPAEEGFPLRLLDGRPAAVGALRGSPWRDEVSERDQLLSHRHDARAALTAAATATLMCTDAGDLLGSGASAAGRCAVLLAVPGQGPVQGVGCGRAGAGWRGPIDHYGYMSRVSGHAA